MSDFENKETMDIKTSALSDRSTDKDIEPGEVLSSVQDEAVIFLYQHDIFHDRLQSLVTDKAAIWRLKRRLDWTLMPLLCGAYMLQYLDKQTLSYGAVFDLFESTHMSTNQYAWLARIFYFAYLAFEWPANYFAQRFPTGTFVSVCITIWGAVLACTAASENFAGIAVCRFILGIFEAPITPSSMMIVSMWYTREEQPARAGLFYCFNGMGSMVGGILFYGIGQARHWNVWRIIFILFGGLAVVWGIVLFFFLPNDIISAKRYTVEEKAMFIARTLDNRTGVLNQKFNFAQVKGAMLDLQVWLLFLFTLLNACVNGGIANFGKLILKGFTDNNDPLTTAYGILYGAWSMLFMFTGPWLASRFRNVRLVVMVVYLLPTLAAVIMFWNCPDTRAIAIHF